jgi:hypothetical protein
MKFNSLPIFNTSYAFTISFQFYTQLQSVVKHLKVVGVWGRVCGEAETVLSPGDKLLRRVTWVKRSWGGPTLISTAACDFSFRKKKNMYFKLLSSMVAAITNT